MLECAVYRPPSIRFVLQTEEQHDLLGQMLKVASRSLYQALSSISVNPLSNRCSHKILLNPSFPSNLVLSAPFSHTLPLQNNEYSSDRRLFVVQPRLRPKAVLKLKLEEAINLANSLSEQRDEYNDDLSEELKVKKKTPHVVVQNPAARSIRPGTYFGQGTVKTIKILLDEANSNDEVFAVFVNATLTGIQQRNLETEWEIPVLDRVGLIIEIFKDHAETKEAKLQAELAALMYKRTRLVRVRGPDGRSTFGAFGESEVVSARGRGSGGRGFIGGAGETELQLQRQRILYLRTQLLAEIKEVRRTRAVQRASRKRHGNSDGQDMPNVAIVGYTNAGKSTLVSELSQTYLYSDDRLFATVDPKLRSVILPSGRKVLLSDTVGFISDLPVQLVEAFQATLEEVVEADLLVHVLDSSAPNIDEHRETVLQVLRQIGVSEEKLQNMIEVYNKIDLQQDEFAEENTADSIDDDGEDEDEQSHEDTVSDVAEDDYSDGWLLEDDNQEDEPETWTNQDDQQKQSQTELKVPRIETSATFGVGLQELLEAIDGKLVNRTVVESSNIMNRKWRPPREEDNSTAV